jgi:uncharacterized membrane protein
MESHDDAKAQAHMSHQMKSPYLKFWVSLAANALLMFVLMFVMIDTIAEFIPNLNFAYMALVMAAPMGIIMLATMPMMYKDKKKNVLSYAALAVIFVASFGFIRNQTFVGNEGFLASMVPHHSGAILMCREAKITDQEIKSLCENIKKAQQQEIDQMNAIRKRLSGK